MIAVCRRARLFDWFHYCLGGTPMLRMLFICAVCACPLSGCGRSSANAGPIELAGDSNVSPSRESKPTAGDRFERTIPAEGIKNLAVDGKVGRIEVSTENSKDIKVKAERLYDGMPNERG